MSESAITVHLDEDPVRFTPDGRMSVLDAISALTLSAHPTLIWEDLQKRHPEILNHCGTYPFQGEESLPIIDREGWDTMWVMLSVYVLEPERARAGVRPA